jgi:hypothetical protein
VRFSLENDEVQGQQQGDERHKAGPDPEINGQKETSS